MEVFILDNIRMEKDMEMESSSTMMVQYTKVSGMVERNTEQVKSQRVMGTSMLGNGLKANTKLLLKLNVQLHHQKILSMFSKKYRKFVK